MLFADILNRIQQELQGRQPLLAVNDFASLHISGCGIHLLNDYGAEEIANGLLFCLHSITVRTIKLLQIIVGGVTHILPEWFPLVILRPDIATLECWNGCIECLSETMPWDSGYRFSTHFSPFGSHAKLTGPV